VTSFQASLGTAFGTFHRYVYKPYKSGGLAGNALAKARSAATAVYHAVVQAKQEAVGGTALRTLFAPLAALVASLDRLSTRLNRGQSDSADIRTINGEIASIEQAAAAAGVKITEQAPSSGP
jgi:hypothetical protein